MQPSTFKLTLHTETYLLLLKNAKEVSALARFRLSSHSLQIELGRTHPIIDYVHDVITFLLMTKDIFYSIVVILMRKEMFYFTK